MQKRRSENSLNYVARKLFKKKSTDLDERDSERLEEIMLLMQQGSSEASIERKLTIPV
ncbi:MAG: hypothetical protein ABW185_23115 [Sedimenticola sp.]